MATEKELDNPTYPYKYENYNEALKEYLDTVEVANTDNTNTETTFKKGADLHPFRGEIFKARTKSARSAIVNRYLQESLVDAAPVPLAMWLLSEGNITKAINFFKTNKIAAELKKLVIGFKNRDADCSWKKTGPMIHKYRKMCQEFRAAVPFNCTLMSEIKKHVVKDFKVDYEHLGQAHKIFKALLEKRKEALPKGGLIGGGAKHLREYRSYMDTFITMGLLLPQMYLRNKAKSGGFNKDGEPIAEGPYLLSTALASFYSRKSMNYKDFNDFMDLLITKDEDLAACVDAEFKNFVQGEAAAIGEGNPFQQVADIDSVVSSAFWIFCLARIDSIESFRNFNLVLYKLGQSPKGRTKTQSLLGKSNIRSILTLSEYIGQCDNIHLPPFVPSISRVEEIFSTYAMINTIDAGSIKHPTVTWRTILNLKHNSIFWDFISNFFALEEAVDSEKGAIQSLHAFHQILLSKQSAFQNIHNTKGNPFDISIGYGI